MSDGLRHVTVCALHEVFPWLEDALDERSRRGCDWSSIQDWSQDLTELCAWSLLRGVSQPLPTCPACAALLDLALEMRGTKEAA